MIIIFDMVIAWQMIPSSTLSQELHLEFRQELDHELSQGRSHVFQQGHRTYNIACMHPPTSHVCAGHLARAGLTI